MMTTRFKVLPGLAALVALTASLAAQDKKPAARTEGTVVDRTLTLKGEKPEDGALNAN